jgi:hypothetical protein
MLKVTLVIDNTIASPDSPEEFVKKNVLQQTNPYFVLREMKVEQDDYFDLEETDESR